VTRPHRTLSLISNRATAQFKSGHCACAAVPSRIPGEDDARDCQMTRPPTEAGLAPVLFFVSGHVPPLLRDFDELFLDKGIARLLGALFALSRLGAVLFCLAYHWRFPVRPQHNELKATIDDVELAKSRGKTRGGSRVYQMLARHGAVETLRRLVKQPTEGLEFLVKIDRIDLAAETVALKYEAILDEDIIVLARLNLDIVMRDTRKGA
jgi:hypothetical protein